MLSRIPRFNDGRFFTGLANDRDDELRRFFAGLDNDGDDELRRFFAGLDNDREDELRRLFTGLDNDRDNRATSVLIELNELFGLFFLNDGLKVFPPLSENVPITGLLLFRGDGLPCNIPLLLDVFDNRCSDFFNGTDKKSK